MKERSSKGRSFFMLIADEAAGHVLHKGDDVRADGGRKDVLGVVDPEKHRERM